MKYLFIGILVSLCMFAFGANAQSQELRNPLSFESNVDPIEYCQGTDWEDPSCIRLLDEYENEIEILAQALAKLKTKRAAEAARRAAGECLDDTAACAADTFDGAREGVKSWRERFDERLRERENERKN